MTSSLYFRPDKLTHTKSKVIITQKVCKTKVFTKKYQKIPLILFRNARNKYIWYKSTFRNTSVPIWMGYGGISIESLVIVLYNLFPVFLSSGHARRRFDTASGIFCHQTCFLILKPLGSIRFYKKK